ncbi:hypothetical protein E5M45_19840 [Mycobacterium tuberculosis]|nr:hypothetical protein [Mycobacterium tuberculosis]WJH89850.1 hypothetical protein FF955_18450 [Mycobacterium tuberculosis complex sp. N0155]QOK40052.1 hypothetical protein FPJ49_18475 [Mycobacterium tuberculosis]QOO18777.1 hypothetical protein FPJ61_18480 [Mycobacterium tuberculosis]QOO51703.1 hypothetical protein FPJ53_18490 [Mycobacterium tuberculosis]
MLAQYGPTGVGFAADSLTATPSLRAAADSCACAAVVAGEDVTADGGGSWTRKLTGIDFPGMSWSDVIARVAFGVLSPVGCSCPAPDADELRCAHTGWFGVTLVATRPPRQSRADARPRRPRRLRRWTGSTSAGPPASECAPAR